MTRERRWTAERARGKGIGALALAIVLGSPASAVAQSAQQDSVEQAHDAADDVELAEGHAAQAFEAYSQRDYARAVELYRKAYDAAPTADILFNIARIYDVGLRDRALAITYYRSYVVDPDADVYRLDVAFDRLTQLEASDRADAPRVTPSAVARVATPRRSQVVSDAAVSKVGFWSPWRVGAIVAGTVGLVGVGLGAGFGAAALSDASTAREYCDGNVCSSQRGVDATHSASKNADIATASFALGGTLLATGVVLLWLDDRSTSSERARLRVSPVATGSELGLALAGRW
jgi:tetratricopeptide (TPR) repeat protein